MNIYENMNFEKAVDIAKIGREEGYQYLYEQTYQRGYYVALKYMKQEDAAKDVLQEAYIKAFQNLEQLKEPQKFASWFSRIVATKALDELRKEKPILFSLLENEDGASVVDNFEDERNETAPEIIYEQHEVTEVVKDMIEVLPDEQRICIIMFYMEQLSVKEIAEILKCNINTIKSRLSYGRKSIKGRVEELEKRGVVLYVLSPMAFFTAMLTYEAKTTYAAAPEIIWTNVLAAQASQIAEGLNNVIGEAVKAEATPTSISKYVAAKYMALSATTKTAACITAVAILTGGVATGVHFSNQWEKSQKSAETVENNSEKYEKRLMKAYSEFLEGDIFKGCGFATVKSKNMEEPVLLVFPKEQLSVQKGETLTIKKGKDLRTKDSYDKTGYRIYYGEEENGEITIKDGGCFEGSWIDGDVKKVFYFDNKTGEIQSYIKLKRLDIYTEENVVEYSINNNQISENYSYELNYITDKKGVRQGSFEIYTKDNNKSFRVKYYNTEQIEQLGVEKYIKLAGKYKNGAIIEEGEKIPYDSAKSCLDKKISIKKNSKSERKKMVE